MKKNTGGYESLDNEEFGDIEWDHGLDLDKERENALFILSKVVPASEIFLTSSKAQNVNEKFKRKQQDSSNGID